MRKFATNFANFARMGNGLTNFANFGLRVHCVRQSKYLQSQIERENNFTNLYFASLYARENSSNNRICTYCIYTDYAKYLVNVPATYIYIKGSEFRKQRRQRPFLTPFPLVNPTARYEHAPKTSKEGKDVFSRLRWSIGVLGKIGLSGRKRKTAGQSALQQIGHLVKPLVNRHSKSKHS